MYKLHGTSHVPELVQSTPAQMWWVPTGDCHLCLPRHRRLRRAAREPLLSAFARSAAPPGAASIAPGCSSPGDISPAPFLQEHATAHSPPPQPPPSFSSRFSSLPQSFFCLQPWPFVACKFNKYSLCFSMLAVNGSAQ